MGLDSNELRKVCRQYVHYMICSGKRDINLYVDSFGVIFYSDSSCEKSRVYPFMLYAGCDFDGSDTVFDVYCRAKYTFEYIEFDFDFKDFYGAGNKFFVDVKCAMKDAMRCVKEYFNAEEAPAYYICLEKETGRISYVHVEKTKFGNEHLYEKYLFLHLVDYVIQDHLHFNTIAEQATTRIYDYLYGASK
jgi:hypothetical protein